MLFKKKDKNELTRVVSNDSVKSSKSVLRSLFFREEKAAPEQPSLINEYLKSNGLSSGKVLFNDEIKLTICNDNIFLPTLTRDDEDDLNDSINESDDIIHTFAVVLNVPKPTKLALDMELKCICKSYWPNHPVKVEQFKLGELGFNLNLKNYNSFIPLNNFNLQFNDNVMGTSYYRPFIIDDVMNNDFYKDIKKINYDYQIFPPGDYIYLLPISFPLNIPESIVTENASTNYSFNFNISLENDNHYLEHFINLIRSAPNLDVSTFNKPIYINKTWDDALNYEISFPSKFVTINEKELQIKLNLIPLVKKININKIKINILQKITYLNKDLNKQRCELDEVKYKNGHTINLVEIKPDDLRYNSFAAKEDLINKIRLTNRNFLTCSYVNGDDDNDSDDEINWDKDELIGPLTVKTFVPFPKPSKSSKYYKDNQFFNENWSLKELLVDSSPKTNLKTHQGTMNEIPLMAKLNSQFVDGLLPSCSTNHIHIQHKLQICLRITRKTDKIHNYEVLIDTPIFLLNSACIHDNIELPPYIGGDLPSFEEATSPLNSPILSPYEETYLSRTNTIMSNYDDLSSQIDDLMLSNSLDVRRSSTGSAIVNNLMRTMSKDPPDYQE